MDLVCEERLSDSPFVELIWRSQSDRDGEFISIAQPHWEIVVTKLEGKTTLTVRGPETRATPAYCPADGEFLGIVFKFGAFMPHLPTKMVMDRRDMNLPEASSRSFWLNGSAWQYFDYDNAETFVNKLVREGLLVYDPLVDAVLQRRPVDASLRTVQRRFVQATGLTNNMIYQINRARRAMTLLKQGASILDTVHRLGYADQPHLTRSLNYLIGQSPAQIIDQRRFVPVSFLFKTDGLQMDYDTTVQLMSETA
jgi:AraC-like DNA-binding protein